MQKYMHFSRIYRWKKGPARQTWTTMFHVRLAILRTKKRPEIVKPCSPQTPMPRRRQRKSMSGNRHSCFLRRAARPWQSHSKIIQHLRFTMVCWKSQVSWFRCLNCYIKRIIKERKEGRKEWRINKKERMNMDDRHTDRKIFDKVSHNLL